MQGGTNTPTDSQTLPRLPAISLDLDQRREGPAEAGPDRLYGKPGIPVHLEIRIDSKHRKFGFLALSEQADKCLEAGDSDGCGVWKRVLKAVEELLDRRVI